MSPEGDRIYMGGKNLHISFTIGLKIIYYTQPKWIYVAQAFVYNAIVLLCGSATEGRNPASNVTCLMLCNNIMMISLSGGYV